MTNEFKYIKGYLKDESVKVITNIIAKNNTFYKLDFDYYVKDSRELICLLQGTLPNNKLVSNYGNKDIFEYDTEKNILSKSFLSKNQYGEKTFTRVFPLFKELKEDLINFIIEADNQYTETVFDDYVKETERQIVNRTLTSVKKIDPELNNLTDIIDFKEEDKKTYPEPIEEIKEQEEVEDMITMEEMQNLKTPNSFSEATNFGELLRVLDKEMFFVTWIVDISTGRIENNEKFEFKDLEGKPINIKRNSNFIGLLYQYANNNSNFEGWKLRLQQLFNQYNEYMFKKTTETKNNTIEVKKELKEEIVKNSKKTLKDFNEFKDVKDIHFYLSTSTECSNFIKWLQDNKLITLNHSYAPIELSKKPIEELNKLREEYLNN